MIGQFPNVGPLPSAHFSDGTISVLHVDDDPAFAQMCAEFLQMEGDRLTVETETSAAAALERLPTDEPDCIVSDYEMPGTDGLEFLEAVRESHPDLPFILFTGKGSEEIASEAISAGVTDYLQKSRGKDQFQILKNRIVNGVETHRSQRSLHLFRAAAEHSGHSIYITDSNGVIEYVNPSFTETTGYPPEEAIGKTPRILKSGEHSRAFYENLWSTILGGDVWESQLINERRDGERYVVDQTIAPIRIREDDPEKFVAVNQEITDRKAYQFTLENQCENLGILNRMLRYGIRDDLQSVTGYAELLEESVDADGTAHLDVLKERAWDGVERIEAARGFAELLGRRDPTRTPIELQEIVERTIEDIRSLDRNVEIRLEEPDDRSAPIAADSVVESIVRLLVENVVLCGQGPPGEQTGPPREMTVSVAERDDRVSIRVFEGELDDAGDFEELPSEDALGLESAGVSSSDLYLIQGFVEGYGGSVRLTTDGSGGTGFAVEFPVRESFIGDTVGIVERPA